MTVFVGQHEGEECVEGVGVDRGEIFDKDVVQVWEGHFEAFGAGGPAF